MALPGGVFTMLAVYLVALCAMSTGSNGYILDSSCDKYKAMLDPMLASSFDLAQAGLTLINDMEPAKKPRMTGRRLARLSLVKQLFAKAIAKDPKTGQDVIKGGSDAAWGTMKSVLEGVLEKKTLSQAPAPPSRPSSPPKPGNQKPTREEQIKAKPDWEKYAHGLTGKDTVVFCGTGRFEQAEKCDGTDDEFRACDRTLGGTVLIKKPTDLYDVIDTCDDPGIKTQAFTYGYEAGDPVPSTLTLCEPWLKFLQGYEIKTVEDARKLLPHKLTPALQQKMDDDKGNGLTRSVVDLAIVAGDAVLLHEFTHAITNGKRTIDSDGSDSYYWHNVRRLSTTSGLQNADSYAFFGLGARLISSKSSTGQDLTILDNGIVDIIANPDDVPKAQTKNKRGLAADQAAAADDDKDDNVLVRRVAADGTDCVYSPGGNAPPITLPGLRPTTINGAVICEITLGPESAKSSGAGGAGVPPASNSNNQGSSASDSHDKPPVTPGSPSKTGRAGGDAPSSASFAHMTITSASTTATPIMTVVPIVVGKDTSSVTYTASRVTTSKGSKPTLAWGYWGPPKFKPSDPCIFPILCPDKDHFGFPPGITGPGNKPPNPPPPPPDADGDEDDKPKSDKPESCSSKVTTVCDTLTVVSKAATGTAASTSTVTSCRTQTACTPTIKASHEATTVTGTGTPEALPTYTAAPFVHPADKSWMDEAGTIIGALKTGAPLTYTFAADGAAAAPTSGASGASSTLQTTTKPASAPMTTPRCLADGAPWYSPTSWCDCGATGTYPTLPAKSGQASANCAYTVLPSAMITPKQTSAAPTNIPGMGGLPGCHASVAVEGTSAFCDCGGTPAPTLKPTQSDFINCAYTIQPTSVWDPTIPKPTTAKPAPPPSPSPPPPKYATGRCGVHVAQYLGAYAPSPEVGLIVTIKDGKGNSIKTDHKGLQWGKEFSVDSPLPFPLKVTPIQDAKKRRKRAGGPVFIPRPASEKGYITFSYDSQSWDSTEKPQCNMGGWDNGNFEDAVAVFMGGNFEANRQMDCSFDCPAPK